MEKQIKDILKTIDAAINNFQGGIPGIQQQMFDELQAVIKDFQLSNGKLLNNLHNLKLLATLKNKLQKVIINKKYKDAVNEFIDHFTTVGNLQVDYFKQFNKKYTPAKTLPIIKEMAVETTINDLVGQGMNQLVVGSVEEILRQNITSGGSYLDLQKELENHILDNYKGEGSLTKYTRQITTDAINQYNRQYHEAIAQDLNFNWGRYVGSLITTSREFCIQMTKLDYFHKSQLPGIVKGNIDGYQCKLSKTTGLPYGMIPGTNPDNFKIRCGGYICGHAVYWVPDSAVPEHILRKFESKGKPLQTNFIESLKKKIEHNLTKNDYENMKDVTDLNHTQLVNLTGGVPSPNITNLKHSVSFIERAGIIHSSIYSDQYRIQRDIHYDDKWIYNALMRVHDQGKGIGLNLFLNQVKEARQSGFKYLKVSAEGSYSIKDEWNGYVTWARFGYVMSKESQLMFKSLMKANSRKEKTVFELVSTKEGLDFWEKNGNSWSGEFDLKENSQAMKNLKEYLNKRSIIFDL